MVLRGKKINCKSDTVQLQVSFSLPDVKALFHALALSLEPVKDYPLKESDVRHWLENDGRAFISWPPKWKEQLSGWAFAVAVRNKLLNPSATDENKYYLADFLFTKRGRPPKNDGVLS